MSLHSLAISFTSLGGFAMGMAASLVGGPAVVAAGGVGGHQLLAAPIRAHADPAASTPVPDGVIARDYYTGRQRLVLCGIEISKSGRSHLIRAIGSGAG